MLRSLIISMVTIFRGFRVWFLSLPFISADNIPWHKNFYQTSVKSPILMFVCRLPRIGVLNIFQIDCPRVSTMAKTTFLVYLQLKKRWEIASSSFWHRRHTVWVLITWFPLENVVRKPHLILHKIIENLVGMCDGENPIIGTDIGLEKGHGLCWSRIVSLYQWLAPLILLIYLH